MKCPNCGAAFVFRNKNLTVNTYTTDEQSINVIIKCPICYHRYQIPVSIDDGIDLDEGK
jgi:endogenous inhibitor of DNA gyrase (YacG/DUF329 family)